jgi:hypothetical protein
MMTHSAHEEWFTVSALNIGLYGSALTLSILFIVPLIIHLLGK